MSKKFKTTNLHLLSTCIDDASPEQLPQLIDKLLSLGAKDAWMVPIIMKKGRPAIKLEALVEKPLVHVAMELIFTHSTTLGIRETPVNRAELERRVLTVNVGSHDIRVKVGIFPDGTVSSVKPEFDDCQKAAEIEGKSIEEISFLARAAAHQEVSTLE